MEMHFRLILLVSATCLIGSAQSASTVAVAKEVTISATTAKPQGFSARSIEGNEEDDEFESQAQTHLAYQQRPVYDYSQSEEEQEEPAHQYYQNQNRNPIRNVKQQSNYLKFNKQQQQQQQQQSSEEIESEEEEQEEPDKLSTLLSKSTFNCNSKTTGYYADDTVNCEVFHYCQDNQRHSWVCPDGFTFHQIHLICMPPSNENICQQSAKYHIVNDYLYKPINLQEHQSKPNVTLRYSERYYPENYYETDRYEDEEEIPRQRIHHHRQPVQIGFQTQQLQHQAQPQPQQQQQQQQQYHRQQPQQQQQQQYQQQRQQQAVVQQIRHQAIQQHQAPPQQTTIYRRPVPTTTIQPQLAQIQPQLVQHRLQTAAPVLATPTPYRFFTATPQQLLAQQVYRTPEEINISLQQRRPQFIVATTPRYYEDEYLYERRK